VPAFEELNRRRRRPVFGSSPIRETRSGFPSPEGPAVTAGRELGAFFYQVDGVTGLPTQSGSLDLLRRAGLPVNPETRIVPDLEAVFAYCRDLESRRHLLGYEIDGVVVKVEDRALHSRLGRLLMLPGGRSRTSSRPRNSPPARGHPGLDRAHREGDAVAKLQPVRIAGSVVELATLHNEDQGPREGRPPR